jgi:hypothetical protein
MFDRYARRLARARRGALAAATLACAALAASAAPALAESKTQYIEEFKPFRDCPVATAFDCTVSLTIGGEFKMGSKTVAINKTITLQGGLAAETFEPQPLIGAADGNTLSKTPLTVPGGLLGIPPTEEITGEVTATSELAGPPSSVIINRYGITPGRSHAETAVTLPLKVHLENPALGPECYIGSNTEPIVLHLTAGASKAPGSGEVIKGEIGFPSGAAKGKTTILPAVMVDNTFSVPGATGCVNPLSLVMDTAVDLSAGLPSAAGSNKAIMQSKLEETKAEYVVKYKPKEKKHRK